MEADERVVTFCPSCGELMRDVVLGVCPKCGFDFRTKVGQALLWVAVPEQPVEPEKPVEPTVVAEAGPDAPAPPAPQSAPRTAWPTAAEVPLGSPPPGRRSGWECQLCGRDCPTLWRVVIATPAGFEERFICGTTHACQLVSFVPAFQV